MVRILWEMYEEMSDKIKVSEIDKLIAWGKKEIAKTNKLKSDEYYRGFVAGWRSMLEALDRQLHSEKWKEDD